ncbi:MAG TPA: phospho-sugar mutase [Candidatus Faecalibacterium intestinipullorum]|nr:phospho-sugar mutase [Candidatus Faecalibacterium intestinipullorum]
MITNHTEELYRDWSSRPLPQDLQEELASIAGDPEGISDRFYRDLAFGTGGLRGVIGAGTNRMNIYTVGKASQGYAQYLLKKKKENLSVAIAYDSRIKSEEFARRAAEVFAANGIRAYIYPELMPTPALSFAIRCLGCDGGVVITASHNPAKYNGYKVYGPDGCQITTEAAREIQSCINALDLFADVKAAEFDGAVADGRISYIGGEVVDAYIAAVSGERLCGDGELDKHVSITYTPLNGAGLKCVLRTLGENGFSNIHVVPEQEKPDGNFPTCPYPNPEIREAMELGIQYAKKNGSDLLLATDPDCDRVGIAVRDGEEYVLLSANEVGLLLFEYICERRIALGRMPERPLLMKTIVTMDHVKAIADHYHVQVIDVLTGFKFIGEQIGLLEAAGEADRYIFGFEESYGYLSGAHVRDKDAVNATLLVCEAAAWYAQQGMTLLDAIEKLYAEFGCYRNRLESFAFEGEKGMHTMQALMAGLRAQPPAQIGGLQVTSVVDYNAEGTGLPAADVLEFRLEGGAKLMVRPSGTEPKIKVYLSAVAPDEAGADQINETLAQAAAKMLQG